MIDLHIHTNHSDGTDSVEELLLKAEEKRLEIISITDHDQVGAYIEIENKPDLRKLYSGKIITGAELKTFYNDISIEVLAYGFDYKKLRINEIDIIEEQKKWMVFYKNVLNREGFKYNEKNLYIDKNNPEKHWAAIVVATELLKYPENNELIKKIGEFTVNSFFRMHQCNKNSIFYINECNDLLDLNEMIFRIHEAGGLVFLAHPFIYPYEDRDKVIEEILKTTNIDGLECEYPLFSLEEREKIRMLAKKYNKYICGGTDYHAKNKPNTELGTGINNNLNISQDIIKDWISKIQIV